jgi:hypothetical protein
MAETTGEKKRKAGSQAKETVQVTTGAIEVTELEGFTPEEIAMMVKAKQAIASGRYSDVTNEHKKLLFVQWLIEHGRIGS